jgi:hypothetical protein
MEWALEKPKKVQFIKDNGIVIMFEKNKGVRVQDKKIS